MCIKHGILRTFPSFVGKKSTSKQIYMEIQKPQMVEHLNIDLEGTGSH